MTVRSNLMIALGAGLALGAPVSAGVVLTFGFTELSGSYAAADDDSGLFSARAVATPNLMTEGDVTRLEFPGDGTAEYDHGFFGEGFGGQADVRFNITRNGTAGAGEFRVIDINGDALIGTLTGEWISLGGATFFNGTISGAFTTTGGDSAFNGPSGVPSSFSMFANSVLDGGVTLLFTNHNSDFFGSSFRDVSVLTSATFVPTPGAALLAAVGGLVTLRRKR